MFALDCEAGPRTMRIVRAATSGRSVLLAAFLLNPMVGRAQSVPETPVCGNGVVEAGEDCDQGGICVGYETAGTLCLSDPDCGGGPGRCRGGPKAYSSCDSNTDCLGGACVRCETFGGNGCAANCTME